MIKVDKKIVFCYAVSLLFVFLMFVLEDYTINGFNCINSFVLCLSNSSFILTLQLSFIVIAIVVTSTYLCNYNVMIRNNSRKKAILISQKKIFVYSIIFYSINITILFIGMIFKSGEVVFSSYIYYDIPDFIYMIFYVIKTYLILYFITIFFARILLILPKIFTYFFMFYLIIDYLILDYAHEVNNIFINMTVSSNFHLIKYSNFITEISKNSLFLLLISIILYLLEKIINQSNLENKIK